MLFSTRILSLVLALAAATPALAADLPAMQPLPADPKAQADYWKGFYFGAGVSVAVAKGAKAQAGGDVFAGYDHHYDNGLVLGVRFDTGNTPWLLPNGRYQGFNFAETSVKVGYEMGRLTPFVTAGAGLAKATNFGSGLPDAGSSINGLFYGPGAVQAVGSVGAGFDYAVTNNLHVGVEARFNNGGGPLH